MLEHAAGKGGKELVLLTEKFALKEKTVFGNGNQEMVAGGVGKPDTFHQLVCGLFNHSIVFVVETQMFAQQKHCIQNVCDLCNRA